MQARLLKGWSPSHGYKANEFAICGGLFLASDDSSFSTGSEFVADGGETAGYPGPAIEGQPGFTKIDY